MWIAPSTGVANAFLEQLERVSSDSTALMLAIFAVFALVHSGLAYLRPYGDLLCCLPAWNPINTSSFLFLKHLGIPDLPSVLPVISLLLSINCRP